MDYLWDKFDLKSMEIISKKDAKSAGLKTYFTGIPCIRGHIDVRSVANGVCFECRRQAQNRHRQENLEECRNKSRDWYAKNKEHAVEWKRNWIKENKEAYADRRKRYRNNTNTRAIEMLSSAKYSSNKKNVPFDLDIDFIKSKLDTGVCELTGLPFDLNPLPGGRQNPYTASMDRIVPEKGYVKSNVRMVLWALNAAFNSYGEDVYATIAKVYLDKKGLS